MNKSTTPDCLCYNIGVSLMLANHTHLVEYWIIKILS